MVTKWEQQLDEYQSIYQYNFLVQKFGEFPHPWINYNTPEYEAFIKEHGYVNHRETFFDEVIFDIDMNKDLPKGLAVAEAQKIAEEISERLKEAQYSHTIWKTGGTGVHIHLFFPELFKFNSIDNRIMKKIILKEYGQGFIRPREAQGKVQVSHNTLIQLEFAKHRKGDYKTLISSYSSPVPNLFKKEHWEELEVEKEKNNFLQKHFKKYKKGEKPEAIVFLENEKFHGLRDGRDRALFILTAYYKQFKEGDELFNVLSQWNKDVLGGYFSNTVIKAKIKSAKPCLPVTVIIELFEELGIAEKYYKELIK